MTQFQSLGGSGQGLFPDPKDIYARNATGETLSAGDHGMLDLANAAGKTITPGGVPGSSVFNNVIDATAAGSGIRCWALETIANGADGRFRIVGIVENANVDAATVAGSELFAAADHQLDVTAGNRALMVAIALEADTANKADCLVNGYGMKTFSLT